MVNDPAILRGTSTRGRGWRCCFQGEVWRHRLQSRWRIAISLGQCKAVCTKFGPPSASWLDQHGHDANRIADTFLTVLQSIEKAVVQLLAMLKM